MSQSEPSSTQNNFNISGSSMTNVAGSGSIYYNEAISSPDSSQQLKPEAASDKASVVKTILFLAANPQGTSQLRLQEEAREIDAGLQRAKRGDQFVLQQRWAVRARDIQRAMLDFKPQIVHFSGHGGGEEGLVLENETGNIQFVNTEALAGLFELFALQVECVILNACYSEVQAEAIIRHIPYVIGMNKAIGDKAAIEFALGFYDALGAGESVEFAYKFGCSNIRMAGIAEHLTPVLKKKSS
jgi:CHAT domain-containing protein